MKTRIIFLLSFAFLLCASNPLHAFFFSIKGTVSGLEADHVRISSSAWVEDVVMHLDEEGNFSFYGEHEHPIMITVTYGEGMEKMRADIFMTEDVYVEAKLFLEDGHENVFMRVPTFRNMGFKKALNYVEQLYVNRTTDFATIRQMPEVIEAKEHIGSDIYSHVFALSEMLNYIYTFSSRYKTPFPQSAFEMEEFRQLPINDERFLGFVSYTELMVAYNEREIQRTVSWSGIENPGFDDKIYALENIRNLPEPIEVEITKKLLQRYEYSRLTSNEEKALYKQKLIDLTANYPNNLEILSLTKTLEKVMRSIENQEAPYFALKDTVGESVTSEDLKGKYVLLDVWGSWCMPCRVNNLKLVELRQQCDRQKIKLQFVSIAAKENDPSIWKAAIQKDRMSWMQLLADNQFLENYNITEYPTTILIDPNGIVQKVASSFTMEEIREFANK